MKEELDLEKVDVPIVGGYAILPNIESFFSWYKQVMYKTGVREGQMLIDLDEIMETFRLKVNEEWTENELGIAMLKHGFYKVMIHEKNPNKILADFNRRTYFEAKPCCEWVIQRMMDKSLPKDPIYYSGDPTELVEELNEAGIRDPKIVSLTPLQIDGQLVKH